jgi:uncharacterized protein (TIGR00645 family)
MTNKNGKIANSLLITRWLLSPMYLGLSITLIAYIFVFFKELYINVFAELFNITSETLLLTVLNMVDMVMIANLITMTTIGGYSIFVSALKSGNNWPRFLNGMTSGSLKVKMAASLVSVTSINLLKVFLEPDNISMNALHTKLYIHVAFIGAMIIFSIVEYLTHPPHLNNEKHEH